MAVVTEPVSLDTTISSMEKCEKVCDVGILGLEFYFPRNFVSQEDLEKYNDVSAGKYTTGLGQTEMVFCREDEDVCSLALTVTATLLEKYKIDQKSIGYLEVGTETLIDKSKSVKTVLMDLFRENEDLAGADVKNACYGGTQALFHAVDWVQANYEFEKKLAIVVSVDIAIYAPGPARCTGGAGAIAFLIGPSAPLVVERGCRAFYAHNVYDFFKPVGGQCSEYAVVNGATSVEAYLTAVDATYETYLRKTQKLLKKDVSLQDFHAVLFHSPFSKLTQKALARLAFKDFLLNRHNDDLCDLEALEKFRNIKKKDSFSREFAQTTMASANKVIAKKLDPYLEFCRRLGNMYTPSLYAQLINVIYRDTSSKLSQLNDKKFLMFSYGSGCIAAMFSFKCKFESVEQLKWIEKMRQSAKHAYNRLAQRHKNSPAEFVCALQRREKLIAKGVDYIPISATVNGNNNHIEASVNAYNDADLKRDGKFVSSSKNNDEFFPGTFYLARIDKNYQRYYARVLPSST